MTGIELDRFETALLAELREEAARRGSVSSPRRSKARLVVPVSIAAALVVAAVVGGPGPARPAPTFAVERQNNGDVVVNVEDWSDPAGLERELGRQGVTAEVAYDAQAMRPSDLDGDGLLAACPAVDAVVVDHAENGSIGFTLDSRLVDASDRVLQITAAGGGPLDDWAAVSVTWHGSAC